MFGFRKASRRAPENYFKFFSSAFSDGSYGSDTQALQLYKVLCVMPHRPILPVRKKSVSAVLLHLYPVPVPVPYTYLLQNVLPCSFP